jgi:large subunit ribosomal protein L19
MVKVPDIKAGDLVKVYTRIIEGDKERLAPFQGVVIKIKGRDMTKTFTVRKVSAGIGIERIFPVHSPMIAKIEIKKKGKVRRARLTYLRKRSGKKMKIKEAALPSEAKPEAVSEATEASPEPEEKPGEGAPGPETVGKV